MVNLYWYLLVLVYICCDTGYAQKGCASADPPLCAQYADDKERVCARDYIKNNCLNLCGRCGCPALDPVFCDLYVSKPKVYCRHNWIKKRCKILCGLCDGTPVTSRPLVTGRPRITSRPTVTSRPDVPSTTPSPGKCASPDPPLCEKYIGFKREYCTNAWVTKRCKWFCGLCGKRVTSRPSIATTVATTTTTTTTITLLPASCATPDPKFCGTYVSRRNAYCNQNWVRQRCGHLCGQCAITTTQPYGCGIPDPDACGKYEARKKHYCTNDWVQNRCKNLCGLCDGYVTTPTPPANATECELSDLKVCAKYERNNMKKHYCMNSWVQKNCRNLCGLCGNNGTTIPPTTTPTTTTPPWGCGYSDPQVCGKYVRRKKHYCKSAWVQNRCKNLCGLCGTNGPTSRPTKSTRVTSSRRNGAGCGFSDPQYCASYASMKKHYCRNYWVKKRCKNLCQCNQ